MFGGVVHIYAYVHVSMCVYVRVSVSVLVLVCMCVRLCVRLSSFWGREGDWSSGMIPALGAGGREFDSRITPFCFAFRRQE
jgi:hypothetical protein